MAHELLSIPYSPWSEKAKWALDHHGIEYRAVAYQPILGEPALRVRTRRFTGRVSVPVLFAEDGTRYLDSWSIALFADSVGRGSPLVAERERTEIAEWTEAGERGLCAGRALSLARTLEHEAALAELVPRPLRGVPGTIAVAAWGVRRTLRKYRATSSTRDEHERTLHEVLDAARKTLATRATLTSTFSFADIAFAQVLQYLQPLESKSFRLGRETRAVYSDAALAAEYADLVRWRDELYALHRDAIANNRDNQTP